MKNSEIYIGDINSPLFYFSNAEIVSSAGDYSVDLVNNELSIDRFNPVTRYTYHAAQIIAPSDYDGLETADGHILIGWYNENPEEVPFGTVCWHYEDGQLSRKLYIDHIERVSKDQWAIHTTSIIGVLDVQPHRGGVYTGQTIAEVLVEFFGGDVNESSDGFTLITGGLANCVVENDVATTTVHGLLPYSESKRDNLHQVVFAYCINVTETANGDIVFAYLKNTGSPPIIPRDRIYIGGTVTYEQPVTNVELTEYTYVYDESVEREDVYDNTTAPHIEGEALVTFDPPINPATIQISEGSMTIRDANETSAYVTGNGVISAVPYQVQKRILSRTSDKTPIKKTASVSGITLVNPLNSSNLMDRLFKFYTERKKVKSSIVLDGEKPGRLYQFYNPYDEMTRGFIQRMRWNTTSLTKADCEIITNYTPQGVSTNMQNMVMLTGSGTWEIPSAVRVSENPFIRAVLIQGGQGGHGGYRGADSQRNPDRPGVGGAAGEGGSGGKVFTIDINVKDIATIAFSCGTGGEGGTSDQEGAEGGETTFGAYSSANGAIAPGGILNLIDGKFYAQSGSPGIVGASGGIGGNTATLKGSAGGDLTIENRTYRGGYGGNHQSAQQGGYYVSVSGGGGGGAAAGANGGNGGNGYAHWQAAIGGAGGTGAAATILGTDAQYIGCGGNGGNGGGGGGAPGAGMWTYGSDLTGYIGTGGAGSKGGTGAPGGILIYY